MISGLGDLGISDNSYPIFKLISITIPLTAHAYLKVIAREPMTFTRLKAREWLMLGILAGEHCLHVHA